MQSTKELLQRELTGLNKEQVEEFIERLRKDRPILKYVAGDIQDIFHRAGTKIKFFIGANRSGKTVAGATECVKLALGIHPFIKMAVPNEGWIVSLDYPTSRDVAENEVRRWLPTDDIATWNNQERVIYLKNGSKIGFKSCDSGRQKFQGVARDWIWFDEEPSYDIWQECFMRTIDRKGLLFCTMTPVNGMSWVYDEIYEQQGINPDITVITSEIWDNKYLDVEEIKKAESLYSDEEKDMRLRGKFIQLAGLIYKEFDERIHVIDPIPITKDMLRYRSIDPGLNNPTGCLWGAINKECELFIYDEYYESERTAKENAEAILAISGNDRFVFSKIDPSAQNREPLQGKNVRQQYAEFGLYASLGNNDVRAGIDRVKQWLKKSDVTNRPKIYIFNTCKNLIHEIKRYRWADWRIRGDRDPKEKPNKCTDHLMDALRYLIMGNPVYELYEDLIPSTENWYPGGGNDR